VIVIAVLLPFVWRRMVAEWAILKTGWRVIILSGIFGFTVFNALFYTAAHYTTAVNLTLFQGAIPILVLIASVLFLGIRPMRVQILGMIVTISGVVLISVKGDMEILRTLALNIGDVFTLIACVFYAAYTLGLRRKPPVSGLVFFTALAIVAFVTSVPLLAIEIAQGNVQWPTPKGWLIMLYIGLLPSLLAQVFFIRGVELMGPARAGVFVNLVPVFGALLAVLLLGEPFATYHAVGLALVLGGIWLAERRA
jgi:drug/metabolite transporter (DMT)-like permease